MQNISEHLFLKTTVNDISKALLLKFVKWISLNMQNPLSIYNTDNKYTETQPKSKTFHLSNETLKSYDS